MSHKNKSHTKNFATPFSASDQVDYLERAEKFLEGERPDLALQALKQVPQRLQQKSEFITLRGMAYAMNGDFDLAIDDLETSIAKEPDFLPLYVSLVASYSSLDYSSHTIQTAVKLLKKARGYPELVDMAKQMLEEAKIVLAEDAQAAGLSVDKFKTASFYYENTLHSISKGDFKQAARQAEKAIQAAPEWVSAHNVLALVLFYMGQVDKAMEIERGVLEKFSHQNIHALVNLIIFHVSMWQKELSVPYADQLKAVLSSTPFDDLDLDKVIDGLGMMEDTESLWALASRMLSSPTDALFPISWYVLGAAAANSGHLPEARKLLGRALKEDPVPIAKTVLDAVRKAIRSHSQPVCPCPSGHFPYTHFTLIWMPTISMEMLNHPYYTQEGEDSEQDYEEFEQFMENYISRYPYLSYVGKMLLFDDLIEETRTLGIKLLALSNEPAAADELKRFAASTYGPDELRLEALSSLNDKGLVPEGEATKFWSEETKTWNKVSASQKQIVDHYTPSCDEEALKLVEEGSQLLEDNQANKKSQNQAAKLFKKALEIDPKCASALHNLGAIYMIQERREEGIKLFRQSVEIDPDYLFAYTSLAEYELSEENYAECQKLLQIVLNAPRPPANAFLRAMGIEIRLCLEENKPDLARKLLDSLKDILPEDDPDIEHLDLLVRVAEMEPKWKERWIKLIHGYHNRLLSKPISPDEDLRACLDRISGEALAATRRFWSVLSKGKKADLIEKLATTILDQQQMEKVLSKGLRESEKEALIWLLEAGGIESWKKFTRLFGDDFDEPPHWQYHEPETVPGRLRMTGLLAVGTYQGKIITLIPAELRPILNNLYKRPTTNVKEL